MIAEAIAAIDINGLNIAGQRISSAPSLRISPMMSASGKVLYFSMLLNVITLRPRSNGLSEMRSFSPQSVMISRPFPSFWLFSSFPRSRKKAYRLRFSSVKVADRWRLLLICKFASFLKLPEMRTSRFLMI